MNRQRQNLFTVVHKAIRALLYDIGTALQSVDFATPGGNAVVDRLRLALEMIEEHARHEDSFIFPELSCFVPSVVASLENEHKAIEGKASRVVEAIDDLVAAQDSEAKAVAGEKLSRRFNDFVAHYFLHLNREEEEALPATWKYFTDEEIGAMRTRIQQDTLPERYTEWLRWMFTSQTTDELVKLFTGVKTSAPLPILDKMKQVARETLEEERWNVVARQAMLY